MPSGFLYNIRAVVDKESFQSGIRELEKVEQTSKRMLKGIAGIATAAIGSATIAGQVAQQELRVAKAVGASSEALSSWKIAASVAGASATGLVGALTSLENKMQHLKVGQVDQSLAKNLGMLGIGYGEFSKMNAEERMRAVYNHANGMKDQQLAATLVGDILGQAGRDYYDSIRLAGKDFDQQVNEARKLQFVTEKNRKEAAIFAMEMRGVKEAGKSIALLFGSEMGAALKPTVQKLKNWLIDNRKQIQDGIAGTVRYVGGAFNAIAGVIGRVGPYVSALIDKFGGLDQIIIKVGIGFASMKFMNILGGMKSIISGVNLLKLALGGIGNGLIGTGLYLLFDEFYARSTGGKTFIWDIMLPKLKELKEELGIDIDFDKMANGLKNFGKELLEFDKAGIKGALTLLVDFGKIIGNLLTGNFDALSENIKKLVSDWKNAMVDMWNLDGASSAGKEAYNNTVNNGGSKWQGAANAADSFQRNIPIWGAFYSWLYAREEDLVNAFSGKKVKDGIVAPGGRVTSVSPDDWVFAVKDVADLAGAFIPGYVTNNNSSAESNIVINQNFSIENARGGEAGMIIRQQAYRGTSEALGQTLKTGINRIQLMNGTR